MSGRISYYGGIVGDGLVLHLDAAKKDSYPGSGTLWSDLSGNLNNGTLVNNTFSSLNYGSILFNGSSSYTTLGDNDLFSFTSGSGVDLPFSISGWFRLNTYGTGASSYSALICKSQYNGSVWIREWQFAHSNTLGFAMSIFNPDSSGTNYIGKYVASPLSLNTWYHLTSTYDGSKVNNGVKLYVNGILQSVTNNSSGTYTGMGNTSTTVEFGRQFSIGVTDNGYFNGGISGVLIYRNKVLSASEVLQNYNATKLRFV